MYILILLFISAQGSVAVTTQEMSGYASCYAAKQAVEASAPSGLGYANTREVICVAK